MTKVARVKVPKTAEIGEVVTVKAKIRHPMDTGWTANRNGITPPRRLINKFVCTFNGNDVFQADLQSGISTDPYLMFHAKIPESGVFRFAWFEDGGREYVKTAEIEAS